jgi:SPP1 family predicted phage head-tail adaptor
MSSSGQKQKLVMIQQATLTTDGQGGHSTTWSPRCTAWAHERPLNGREAIAAQQVTAVLSSVWEIHYRKDISVKDRIVFEGRTLQIESIVDPTETRRELWLTCSEVQA